MCKKLQLLLLGFVSQPLTGAWPLNHTGRTTDPPAYLAALAAREAGGSEVPQLPWQ